MIDNTSVRYSTRVIGLKGGNSDELEGEGTKLVLLVTAATGPSMIVARLEFN